MGESFLVKDWGGRWDAERVARGLTHRAKRVAAMRPGSARFCIACGSSVADFGPYRGGWRFAPPLMRELDYTAGDYDDCICPRCGVQDRERHLILYFRASNLLERVEGGCVVHFAPEASLRERIEALNPVEYTMCDIAPPSPEVRQMDLLDLQFEDNSVDLLIANHVLEHVPDADQALAEIRRVLKPEGRAVLQTPFCRGLSRTWEDPAIVSESARLQAFGQEDHVRLFGTDIFDRFESNGLSFEGGSHDELLPGVDAWVNGVDPHEPFFLYSTTA